MTLEVKSVATLLGTPVSYAYAVKAGPWLFLTGHEAFDWRTGAVDEAVAGPPSYPLFGTRHREPPRGRFHLQPDARRARGNSAPISRTRSGSTSTTRTRAPSPPIISPGTTPSRTTSRRAPRSSWSAAFGGDSTISTSLIAVVPRAGIRNPQDPPAGRRLGADIGLCPGRGLQRIRLRRRADGAQSRHRSRSARDRPGICRLGRHPDPQADRVPDPRKAEAGARSGRARRWSSRSRRRSISPTSPTCRTASMSGTSITPAFRARSRWCRPNLSRRSGGIIEINLIALTNGRRAGRR